MRRDDRGVAAVLVLGLAAVLALLAAVTAALGAVAVARHRAASAADLAALAAADRALNGAGPACDAALRASAAVSATLESCRIVGDIAEVVVGVRPPGRIGALGVARARARAGPETLQQPRLQPIPRGTGVVGRPSTGQHGHASQGGQLS